MHSYPSVDRFFQICELNSSLGVSKPSYMLEITYQMHIGFLGKVIENLRVKSLVNRTVFN